MNEKKNIAKRGHNETVDLSAMVYGKLPPQAKELEEAVLGACMLEKTAIDTILEADIKPESFYVPAHICIFQAMLGMHKRALPIDVLTVVEELKRLGKLDEVGGPYYITKLTNAVVSTAHIDAHARIILQKFILRELIRLGGEMITKSYEEQADSFDVLDEVEAGIMAISNSTVKKNYEDAATLTSKVLGRVDDLMSKPEELSGVPSGFMDLDRITYGWQPTDLIILAARPAVGKTAFALNLARNAALYAHRRTPVGFFSLEMSSTQLWQRVWSAESEVMLEKISRGKMEQHEYSQFTAAMGSLEKAPIYVDDTAALNIFEFRAKARRMVNKHGVGLIILDYLQLMRGENKRGGNREQEISAISRGLKIVAKELQVPIIALSQLSRAVESRSEKTPQLSDLRESGAIEQDADMVMFIYRPEYYEIGANEMGESTKGETHIKIAKHRNGTLDTVKLQAHLHIQKFTDWDNNQPSFTPSHSRSWRPVSSQEFNENNEEEQPF